MSKVDYLSEVSILPPNQKFMCISFLSDPDKKLTLSGIRCGGVFETYEEACEQAKKLQTIDPYFNVFVGDMGKWLPFDPNPDSEVVKDSEYADNQLNTMMKAYMENQEKAKLYHEQRKNELVRQNILDNMNTRVDNMNDIKKKMKKSKSSTEKATLQLSLDELEKQISKMEEKKKHIDEQIEELDVKLKGHNKGPGDMNLSPPKLDE